MNTLRIFCGASAGLDSAFLRRGLTRRSLFQLSLPILPLRNQSLRR